MLRRRWANLIRRVFKTDPLICNKCGGQMRIVSFITEPSVIRQILDHLENHNNQDPVPSIYSSARVGLALSHKRASISRLDLFVSPLAHLGFQNAPLTGPRESRSAPATRRPPAFGETAAALGSGPQLLGFCEESGRTGTTYGSS